MSHTDPRYVSALDFRVEVEKIAGDDLVVKHWLLTGAYAAVRAAICAVKCKDVGEGRASDVLQYNLGLMQTVEVLNSIGGTIKTMFNEMPKEDKEETKDGQE